MPNVWYFKIYFEIKCPLIRNICNEWEYRYSIYFLMECIESIHRNLDTYTPTCIRWGILFSQQMSKSKLKDKTMGKGKRGKSDTQVKMLWLCGPLAWNLKNNLFKGQCVQHGKTSWFNTVCSSLPYFISIIIHRVLYFWRKILRWHLTFNNAS